MTLADEIRKYVLTKYIEPARRHGEQTVTVRAGDVHKGMGLTNRMPAVAGALGAEKFEEYANVRLIRREGPHQGANLCLTFELQ
jgi:5-methylcytosine-specific restriction protein B